MKKIPRPSRSALVTSLFAIVPICIGLGVWMWAQEHPLLPGTTGCRFVQDFPARKGCYAGEFEKMVQADGVDQALDAIDEMRAEDKVLDESCHLALHEVGAPRGRAAAKSNKPIEEFGDQSFCTEGYSHGWYIAYLDETDDLKQATAALNKACLTLSRYDDVVSCVHAYGHVAARHAKDDLEAIADACDALVLPKGGAVDGVPEDAADGGIDAIIFECKYGAVMEAALSGSDGRSKLDDNCKPGYPESLEEACYIFLPARMATREVDAKTIAQACVDAPSDVGRKACTHTLAETETSTEDICAEFPSKERADECRVVLQDKNVRT